jgi:protein-tyrosine phosphatase
MIDIHCHLLPDVDDGAKSWEVTLDMCRMAAADGTTHIVATPHANFEYRYDRAAHVALLNEVRTHIADLGINLALTLGCDFHLSFENIEDALANPTRYTIGDTRYLLIELSEYTIFHVTDSIFKLRSAGLEPILTHPERNPVLLKKQELVREYVDAGARVQITANSLTGFWGKHPQKMCESLLHQGLVHFIASDAHGLRGRPPLLAAARKAAEKLVGEAAATRLVEGNPAAVLANQFLLA